MFDFVANIGNDLHPIVTHFPIALLIVSFVLAFVIRQKPEFENMEWWSFAIGALMALPATITGVVAHFPYEETNLHEAIELHQLPSMAGTLIMLIVLALRYRSRRQGQDFGKAQWYLIFAVLGLFWVFIVGGTGGALTYDYGINVRGVNPLLP